jgi:hypothetical protein
MPRAVAVRSDELGDAPIGIGLVDEWCERIRPEAVDACAVDGAETETGRLCSLQHPGERVVGEATHVAASADRRVRAGEPAFLIRRLPVVRLEATRAVQGSEITERDGREQRAALVDRERMTRVLDESVEARIVEAVLAVESVATRQEFGPAERSHSVPDVQISDVQLGRRTLHVARHVGAPPRVVRGPDAHSIRVGGAEPAKRVAGTLLSIEPRPVERQRLVDPADVEAAQATNVT